MTPLLKHPADLICSDNNVLHKRQILSEDEEILVEKIEIYLKERNPQDFYLIHERLRLLRNLGKSVFDYPSLENTQFVKDVLHNEHPLAESLVAFSTASHLLRTPTKVIALRSFLVAKFHAFSLLSFLIKGIEELYKPTVNIAFSVIFTLMAEYVYFSCLEDTGFSDNTKSKLADDLISLWDSGTDRRSIRHLSALSSLWAARESIQPSFGTMDGNTELLRISIDMDNETEWEDFLKNESTNDETRWSLEEFLFGLSFEEINQVRKRLRNYGINAVNYEEVRSFLGSTPIFSPFKGDDPRAIYDFFIERRDTCNLRKRVRAPGPLHTIEEIYLKYRIILEAG